MFHSGDRGKTWAVSETPLLAGIEPREGLPPLESLQGPDVSLGELGALLPSTLEMISEAGLTI